MHRIDDPSNVNTLPAPRQAGTPGYFTQGSPTTGEQATIVTDDWANAVQEELSYVIEQSGLVLSKLDRTQLYQALMILTRQRLTAPITFYVSPSGSDTSGDGLTQATAFASINHAYSHIRDRVDLNGFQATIQLANGTYSAAFLAYPCVGPAILINGNAADASQVTVNGVSAPALAAGAGAQVRVQNFTVTGTGPAGDYGQVGSGLLAGNGGQIVFSNMRFGACSLAHLDCRNGGYLGCPGVGTSYTIVGGAIYHQFAGGGYITTADARITLAGMPAFSTAFCYASQSGFAAAWGCTFTGGATGARYLVDDHGTINTQGAGANYFPGNAAGAVNAATYGVYY